MKHEMDGLLLHFCYKSVALIASLSQIINCHTSLERLVPKSQLLIQSANSPNVSAQRGGITFQNVIGMVKGRGVSSLMDAGLVSGLVFPCKGHLWWACAPRLFTHWLPGEQHLQFANKFSNPKTNVRINVTPRRAASILAHTQSEQITWLLFAPRHFPWKDKINRRHHSSLMLTWRCQPLRALNGGTDLPACVRITQPLFKSLETGITESYI